MYLPGTAAAARGTRIVNPEWQGLSNWRVDPLIWSHFANNPICLQQHANSVACLHTQQGRILPLAFSQRYPQACLVYAHASSPCAHTSASYLVFQILTHLFSHSLSNSLVFYQGTGIWMQSYQKCLPRKGKLLWKHGPKCCSITPVRL